VLGAFTTSTPLAVAAATSTLSSPTPARAMIFRRGAPLLITSASTLVAERTSSASASATASNSAGRSVPSTWRISASPPNAATTEGASGSAISTTGRRARVAAPAGPAPPWLAAPWFTLVWVTAEV
jgi:hypothetical protein